MDKHYSDNDIVIVEATRSILGSTTGSLKGFTAAELGRHILSGLLSRVEKRSKSFSRDQVRHLIIGQCVGSGIGQNLPRQIARLCDMNNIESSFVVNEMCGSGLEAIILGARSLRLDEYPLSIIGGIEVPSRAPYFITREQLVEWKDKTVEEIGEMLIRADVCDALWCKMYDVHTVVHAEDTTREWVKKNNIDPEKFKLAIDEYAVMSHQRALKAIREGALKEEITPIAGASETDELPAERKLKTLQRQAGTRYTPKGMFISNYNSPPPANAAVFMMIMKYKEALRLGLQPIARIAGHAGAGVPPKKFLLAPIKAIKRLFEKTGTALRDHDLLEINPAYGPQILFCKKELGLDLEKVNIYGDCIAYGHPVGAAGARLTTTLLYALKRKKAGRGLVSICLGGGNALALAVERVDQNNIKGLK
ncbi:thiolase family protein [Candidatus Omnitrophota bacterium]